VWGTIEGHVSPSKIVGIEPGQSHEIRRGLVARAFAVNHRVAALGYCVVDVRHKLKAEYADRTGPELAALKKQGVVIEHNVEVPLLAFCGDTAEGAWLEEPMVRQAQVIILECTFFEAEHVRRAREGYHLHVRDVARIIPKLENTHIVLHHVSRRTGIRDAKQALASLLSAKDMERVTFMMDGRRSRAKPPAPNDQSTGSAAHQP
jgi:ribonuclease Z